MNKNNFIQKFCIFLSILFLSSGATLHKTKILKSNYLYTQDGARLQLVSSNLKGNINLIMIPGGPGIGSEYLLGLAEILNVSGNIWLLDLPDNGTNLKLNTDISLWPAQLLAAIKSLDNVVIFGHSAGGMMILSEPGIDKNVKAIIIANSNPIGHGKEVAIQKEKYNLPSYEQEVKNFVDNPTEETMRQVALAYSDYYFTPKFKNQGIEVLNHISYNPAPLMWALKTNFFETFETRYIPTLPTLIILGKQDHMTPPLLFEEDKRFVKRNIKMVKIKNAGHFPWLEQPEKTKKVIENFVKSLK